MRALADREAALAARGVIFPVLLARLTTYSDARTLADPIDTWISSTWRTATWGAEREFWPLLVSGMPQVDRIGHVPIPELTLGGLGGALRRQCTIILRGWDTELGAVAPYLTQSGARDLLGMRVEIGELLLEAPSEVLDWQRIGAEAAVVPLFVGRVEAVLRLGEEIELRLEVELPAMPWLTANDPTTNDPDDLGRVLPLPIGRVERVEAIAWTVGARTTLAVEALAGATALQLTDASGFPSAGAATLGGGEVALYSGKTANQLTGVTGLAKTHKPGDMVIERIGGDAVYVLGSSPLSAVDALYVRSAWSDELLRVTTPYAVQLSDPTVISGRLLATVRFAPADLDALIAALLAAEVQQQPTRSTDVVAPDSLQPVIDIDYASTRSIVSGSLYYGVVDDCFAPYSDSGDLPRANDGCVIRGIFTAYSGGSARIIMQTVYFSASYEGSATIGHVTVSLRRSGATIASIVVNVPKSTPEGLGGYFATFAEPTHDCDADEIRFTIDTDPEGGLVRIGYIQRGGINRVLPGITTQPQVAETGSTEVQLRAASVGGGLRFYADVQGPLVPWQWQTEYAFDSDAEWSESGITRSQDTGQKVEGASSTKLAAAQGALVQDHLFEASGDGVAVWRGTLTFPGGGVQSEGSACASIVKTSGDEYGILITESPSLDLSNATLEFDVWLENGHTLIDHDDELPGSLNNWKGSLMLILLTGGAFSIYSYGLDNGLDALETWKRLKWTPEDVPTTVSGGGVNLANVTRIDVRTHAPTAATNGFETRVDHMVMRSRITGIAQRNAAATLSDWSSAGPVYRFRVRADAPARISRLELAFADEIETGTTEPSARRTLPVPVDYLVAGQWMILEIDPVDVGGPTVLAVRTVRLELDTDGQAAVGVWIDWLESGQTTGNPYSAAPDTLIEAGPDVLRYLFEELVQPPQQIDATLAGALATHLGADVFGADLRALGSDFGSVVERLGVSMRASIFPLDRLGGAIWGCWAAEADGTWPAATLVLSAWEGIVEVPAEDRPPTELDLLYRWHAHRATRGQLAERAWQGLVAASDPAAAARRGTLLGDPVILPAIYDAATAEEVAAILGAARLAPGRLFELLGVPAADSYPLEIGDLVQLTLPAELDASTLTVRLIGVRRDFDVRSADLVVQEVAV